MLSFSGGKRTRQGAGVKAALALVIALAIPLGCGPIKFTDVSDHPDFVGLVGMRCRLIEPMTIRGLNLPPGYCQEIQIYVIYPASGPGMGGPEFIGEDTLEVGTVLTVQSVIHAFLRGIGQRSCVSPRRPSTDIM